jgi:hypothetical protein
VTRPGGRVVVVEPDNAARYAYSSVPAGAAAFAAVRQLFGGIAAARGEDPEPAVGPTLAERFARHDVEAVEIRVFPVSHTFIGAPAHTVWADRRTAIEREAATVPVAEVSRLLAGALAVLDDYERQASAAGAGFVEIQSTPLFATVGQRLGGR